MSLLTFKAFKHGPAKRISGIGVESEDFRDYTNEATRQLMRRGNFWATVQPVQGCVYDSCLVWPRSIASVLALKICNRAMTVQNNWYQFLPWQHDCYGLYDLYQRNRGAVVTDTDGTLPVFRQIPTGSQFPLNLYIDDPNDQGKTIAIFGLDNHGQVIRSRRSDGTTRDGLVLTLARTGVQTPYAISRVDRVLKDITYGPVRMYMVDQNNLMLDMAVYQPNETSPEYIRNRIRGYRDRPFPSINNCCALVNIEALVKLAFVPVYYDEDLILIENQDALANMIMSMRYKEQGDAAKGMQFEQLAFHEMNLEMRDRFPNEQFVVNFQPFTDAPFSRVTGGFY